MRSFFSFFRKGRVGEGSSPKGASEVLSFLQPDQLVPYGLPGIAIQGTFTDSECTVEGFRENPAFVDFMHEVIRTAGPTDLSMQEAAAEQKDGFLYVIDT